MYSVRWARKVSFIRFTIGGNQRNDDIHPTMSPLSNKTRFFISINKYVLRTRLGLRLRLRSFQSSVQRKINQYFFYHHPHSGRDWWCHNTTSFNVLIFSVVAAILLMHVQDQEHKRLIYLII